MRTKFFLFVFLFSYSIYAGGFENLGAHSRVVSLGGAFTGVGDASYTVFYNPAGIATLSQFEFTSTYNKLFSGIDDDLYYLTFSSNLPIGKLGNLGTGLTHLKAGGWQENTLIISYAKNLVGTFNLGGSFKFLRWNAEAAPGEATQTYTGFTFDLGVFYTIQNIFGNGIMRFGASALDITQPSISINGSDDAKLPIKFATGISYYSPNFNYLIAVDGVKENENYVLKFGAEFLGMKTNVLGIETRIFIRGGYNSSMINSPLKQSSINGGFGIWVDRMKIDYGYFNHMEIQTLGGSHIISIGYQF